MSTTSLIVAASMPVILPPLATARPTVEPAPDETAFITDWYLPVKRKQDFPNSEQQTALSHEQ